MDEFKNKYSKTILVNKSKNDTKSNLSLKNVK